MKGDFSRVTFDPVYNFSRVLLQQGRVQLDADFNEQTAILLHALRRLTADLFGPYAIPAGQSDPFVIEATGGASPKLHMSGGRAYIGGLLVEADDIAYAGELSNQSAYILYLDVWERHVTYHETAALIREVALGGPDTATRAQVVCRLRASDTFNNVDNMPEPVPPGLECDELHRRWPTWAGQQAPGLMRARAGQNRADEACVVPSDSRYRGLENQLYRVEVHRGGAANEATFKWSRDNGSVVFPLAGPVPAGGKVVQLLHLGRDERFGLKPGEWVEIVNDDYSLSGAAEPLLQVVAVDPLERTVELSAEPDVDTTLEKRPLLRRWDQREGEESEGGLSLDEGAAQMWTGDSTNPNFGWLSLEDGIEVQFDSAGQYRTGDYWLIPARTATGNIEWPLDTAATDPTTGRQLPARREEHYTMPLAIVVFQGNDNPVVRDCRWCFDSVALGECAGQQ